VQGVGYRFFVQKHSNALGLSGYARNQDDGSVLVYAVGASAALDQLEAQLRHGPPHAEVRGVDVSESEVTLHAGFRIR
jgi:acylphosphatase